MKLGLIHFLLIIGFYSTPIEDRLHPLFLFCMTDGAPKEYRTDTEEQHDKY